MNSSKLLTFLLTDLRYYCKYQYVERSFSSVTRRDFNNAPKLDLFRIGAQNVLNRNYAKGKDKKKEKGQVKVNVNENHLSELINVESLKTQMGKAIDLMKEEFIRNLSLRSQAGSIELLKVELDGEEHTLQELAQLTRKNPKMVVVNMAVFPQAIPNVLKALQKSGMNLNPQQEGTTLYIPIPTVTKEYREQMAKSAKQSFVKCRDSIKDAQNKQVKQLKKKQNVSEDIIRSSEQQVIAMSNAFIEQAKSIFDSKVSELLGNSS